MFAVYAIFFGRKFGVSIKIWTKHILQADGAKYYEQKGIGIHDRIISLYSRLKAMLNQFHGASKQYLNRYLARFVALEQAGRSMYSPAIDAVSVMLTKGNAVRPI